ncbi:MAG TPA: hypothetical protein VMX12_10005 [Acidimicrobiia bacterium]|nr:hypothetical protein [Acidimicrobiia bacterium]
MADDLAHWKKRLDDEYGQVTRRFDDIHERFDKVANAQPEDDLFDRLNELEKRVKKIRTGGWFRPGARHHRRVLKKYNAAKAAGGATPTTTFGS